MDNFDLHSYLRNNPLLKESVEKEEKKKLTKEEFKAMVKEMVLAETGVDEYLGGTMDVPGGYGMDDDSQTEGDFFTISLPNGFPVQYARSYEEAKAWVEKNDPEGMKDYQIDQVDESLNEMARIATFYVLTDDFEEAIAGMPENKQKSSRYQRVINYLKDNGQGTLKDIADEEFRTSETAAVSPIMADLVSYGVAKKGDLVAPKKEKPVGDGTRGRKMSDVGRVKSAMEKFKAGSSDYTDEERVALKAFIDSISATLEEGKVNEVFTPSLVGAGAGNSLTSLLITGLLMGLPYIVTTLPGWFKEKIKDYNLDKNSTKEEIEAAAKDLSSKITSQEKSVLDKYLTTLKTGETKDQRVMATKKAQKYMDKLNTRYSDNTSED